MQNSPYCCCVYQFSHPANVHRQDAHGMRMAADTVTTRKIQLATNWTIQPRCVR